LRDPAWRRIRRGSGHGRGFPSRAARAVRR
jgi:hypothetical protein